MSAEDDLKNMTHAEVQQILLAHFQAQPGLMNAWSQAVDDLGPDLVAYAFEGQVLGFMEREKFLRDVESFMGETYGMDVLRSALDLISEKPAIDALKQGHSSNIGCWMVMFFDSEPRPFCGAFGSRRFNSRGGSA